MKHFKLILTLLICLLLAVFVWTNFYFFRLLGTAALSKEGWILLSIIVGGVLGSLFAFLYKTTWVPLSKTSKLSVVLSVIGLSLFFLLLPELYFHRIYPNSLSESVLEIGPLNPGSEDEIVIDEIRIDQTGVDWRHECQIKGRYRWGNNHELTLENGADPGKIQCLVYPLRVVDVIFKNDTVFENVHIRLNNQDTIGKFVPLEDRSVTSIAPLFFPKLLLPNLVLFLDALICFSIMVLVWIWLIKKERIHHDDSFWRTPITWLVLGYLICYGLFFITPIFFNDRQTLFTPETVSGFDLIGVDFRWIVNAARTVLFEGQPLKGTFFSPASFYLFIPFTFIDIFSSYKIYTLIKWGLFVSITFLLPAMALFKKDFSVPLFFLLSGLMSYGFQLETERGQWYSLTYALVLIALWLYHRYYQNRYVRFMSYGLFCAAVQMKLSPALFVVLFFRAEAGVRGNIKKLLTLGVINFLLLFATGLSNAQAFITSIFKIVDDTYSLWIGNHSIQSFIVLTQQQQVSDYTYLKYIFYLIVLVCLAGLIWRFIRVMPERHTKIDPLLLMGLTLTALLIPTENNDYVLAILPLVLSMALSIALTHPQNPIRGIDLFIISLLYSITTYSYAVKPDILIIKNDCIPLLVMLIYITIIAYRERLLEKTGFSQKMDKTNFSNSTFGT